ncbi:hypothetical protein N7448_002029 [Penicillium atrosanguineum]|uniref:Alpha-L-rhamnosidase six-hairpin glycosidase domain-containing protein n=1 Tax=Penicillium atrosanguineum TaxID=1132637 RepID=A0A9W9PTE4_9EURO|nr:hypothetical protein N7526_006477 [Penicillium atrosanguineum]KAJ5144637.1 hypothetical protein N7448_002029 [Penicillium atrosanguineum]KAJ5311071.1 hypothetical protein N7476_006931 [Penicillium atrosanguineum]
MASQQFMLRIGAVVSLCSTVAYAVDAYFPKYYHLGAEPTIDGLQSYDRSSVTLDEHNSVLTLDYTTEVGGWPWVELESPSSPVQIQLKYSEPFDGLELPQGDGPWLYCNGLMNSFRTETFNITDSGTTQSFFLQGGLRWQSITLIGNTPITIRNIGIKPSVTISDPATLPGSFSTSNDMYEQVWSLGARAVEAACVDAGSQPSTWEISDEGALIRGQYPAVSALASSFANYTLEFSTKITAGGTGWRVAGGANGGYGAYFVLTSNKEGLESSNITSLAQNSLIAGYGFTLIDQAILPSAPSETYPVSTVIKENEWYSIKTVINATGYAISVNGQDIAFVGNSNFESYINGAWGSGSLTEGNFGFGPYLNQQAWYKDVKVTAQNGTVIYQQPFTSTDILQEYAVASNEYAVCLDGAKRDREVWIGDFAHTGRMIAASSGRYDYIKSMIEFEFDWQYPPGPAHGLVPIQAYMGAGADYREVYYPSEFGETDYQFFFLLVLSDYFALTGDKDTLSKNWDGLKLLVQTLVDRYYDQGSGLMASADASWFSAQGSQNATAPTALFVVALNQLFEVATAFGDSDTASTWSQLSTNITTAINDSLWNENIGAYSLSLAQPDDTAIMATAFTIRAGIASSDRVTSSIARLSDVFLAIGYKDSSAASNSASTQLSPNTQGFLLESLFLAYTKYNVSVDVVIPAIQNLSEVFWPKMVTQNEYFTGASWEYLYQDGSPGIGIFTSLSHPWGGAPTYIFSNYILGVRTEWNAQVKSYEWVFAPAWDIAEGLGLGWARGRVPLSTGGYIEAEWNTTSKGEKPTMSATVVGNGNVKINVIERL